MRNLKMYGVETLNTQEMVETDGGFLVALACLAVAAIAMSSCTTNITIGDNNKIDSTNKVDSTANGSGNGSGNGNGN